MEGNKTCKFWWFIAVTYRNVFNSKFTVECTDSATFLRVFFCVCVFKGRHRDINPPIVEKVICRKADSRILAAVFISCPNVYKEYLFYSFQSTKRYRNTGKRWGNSLEACASLLVSVILLLKSLSRQCVAWKYLFYRESHRGCLSVRSSALVVTCCWKPWVRCGSPVCCTPVPQVKDKRMSG